MRIIKLFILLSISSLLLIGCGGIDSQEVVGIDDKPASNEEVYGTDTGVWAKDNFDLQAVGSVLQESENIEDFERRINTDERFNNLDLNGDGYVDYVSVREFDDRDDNQRGFSLFSKFDGNDIQEIASLIFDRDRPNQTGARVYLDGNDQIYGNNYDYEGNWLDKSLGIAKYVFGDRNEVYQSPYYYDNYPNNYTEYRVVETPIYRQRITQYVENPVFVRIDKPKKYKIKSPYNGKSYKKIYAKLANPNKEQIVFFNNRKELREVRREDRKDRRDDRKDRREDRREDRKDRRDDRKEDSKDRKEDRKDDRREAREDRKDGSGEGFPKAKKDNKVKQKEINQPSKNKKVMKQNTKPAKAKNNKGGGKGKN